jgi:cytochrome c-type biogenesis protein CcmH
LIAGAHNLAILSSLKMKLLIPVVLILAASGIFYALNQSQNPEGADSRFETQDLQSFSTFPKVSKSTPQLESVDVMLIKLKNRLENGPDDVDGWVLLSKSYHHLNRLNEANEAFEKAKTLGYTGNWKPLPQTSSASQQNYSLQNVTGEEGSSSSIGKESSGKGVKLKVSLAPGLVNELPLDSIVFIFARAADSPGPPLAALRKTVGELPLEITLDDSHSMIQGRTISNAGHIVVGARISLSGNPTKQAGDFEQLSNPMPSNSGKVVELVISDKI